MMHRTALAALTVVLFAAAAIADAAEDQMSDAKRTDITALLDVTGALNVGKRLEDYAVNQMTNSLKESRPDIPDKMYDVLKEEVHAAVQDNLGGLAELLIPIYHEHFTHSDIKGLLAFYRSDLGKKTIALMTVMAREGLEIGRQWGRTVAPEIRKRVMARFKQHGYEI